VGIFEDVEAEVATLVVGVLPDGSELAPEDVVVEEEPVAEPEQPVEEYLEEPDEDVLEEPDEASKETVED
jgi:hypothetical protein